MDSVVQLKNLAACFLSQVSSRSAYPDLNTHRPAEAVLIQYAGQRIHRWMAQEQIQYRLFQWGAIVVRAVAPLTMHHQPAFFATVLPFVQHIAEVTQGLVHKKTMQINLACKRQTPGTQRTKTGIRNLRQINGQRFANIRRMTDTLRFNAAAL